MKLYSILVLTVLTFIIVLEFSVVMPLGPQIADFYGISRNRVTFLFVGYTSMGLLSPLFGYLADKYGLKRYLMLSVLFFAIGAFINANATTSTVYFIGRSILGVGFFTSQSLIITYLSKIIAYNKLGIVSGLQKFSFASAMFFAPIVGTFFINRYSINSLYLSLGIAGSILLILLFPLQEVKGNKDFDFADLKRLLMKKEAVLLMLASLTLSLPSVYFFNYLSVFLQDIGYSVARASWMFSIVAIGSIAAGVIIIIFSDRFGKLRMSKTGLYISLFALFGFFFRLDPILIIAGVMFGVGYDLIWGLFFPVCSNIYKRGVNTFITLLSMFMSLGGVISSITAPTVMDTFGFSGNLIVAAVSLAICIVLFTIATKPYKTTLNR